jgi:hypothetical protein
MPDFNDIHVHLTNYVQEGPDPRAFLRLMDGRVGRAALFGIPLQQQWVARLSAERPRYYLDSAAPLYYYSFTDAYIAMLYRALSPAEQARFDPMITGFNPSDMYATDHIKRVLETFPGVFSGIGEFTIHKEFVTSKVAGEIASLGDPALDRIFDFCGEVGLVALMHCDMDTPFAPEREAPANLAKITALFRRHPQTATIWAHGGLGRVVRPIENYLEIIEAIVTDPGLAHVHFDISWNEVAKYLERTPDSVERAAAVVERHPDRFLFGSDEVSPTDPKKYFAVYDMYRPLFSTLSPEASAALRLHNYERLFDRARTRVRAWEGKH